MENLSLILDLTRFIVGIIILLYASYTDIKTRRASNILWIIIIVIGSIFIVLQAFIIGIGDDLVYLLFVPIMIVIMYVFFQLRLIFGGADAKALMALSVLVPLYPNIQYLPYLGKSFMPFPWIIFSNSIILFLFIPLSLMIYNIVNRTIEFPYLFLGYKMSVKKAKEKFVWPLERIIDGKRKFSYMPQKFDSHDDLREFEKMGIDQIWVTPKIPFMIPLLLGFICSFIIGDLIFGIMNFFG